MDNLTHRHIYLTESDLTQGNYKTKKDMKAFLVEFYGWEPNGDFTQRTDALGVHVTQKRSED